ncbi:hypothetical protein GIB67_024967 [Kingdonia uniflora]|uniref:Uncharacterized protein n=1 Tax=Kingdonia uniflora TaxID=39325 RepID=A0A7J7NYT1_9MAGN|nr:hypothetical protein GIB67_024967 [Kingdonia uniflora]
MVGVDEGKRQVSGEEVQTNFSKTPGSGSSAQPNPIKLSKIALKYPNKRMLKALSAFDTTGSGEAAKDKRRRVEPLGDTGEKVTEERSAAVDDLKEVEERARLAVLRGEEDTSKMLQVETKANLDEMVKESDRLGHYLILKGYSEEEVDAIKVDTYVEEEDKEEAEAMGIMDGLDGVSSQTKQDNQGDDVELLEGCSEKAVREMNLRISDPESGLSRERETSKALLSEQSELQVKLDSSRSHEDDVLMCNREFAEQFDRMMEVNENREDQYVKAHFRLVELIQVVSDLILQVEEKDVEINKGLKELAEVIEYAEKLQNWVDALVVKGKQTDMAQCRIQGHVQKGNANLRECQHKLDAALIREKVLEGEIKAKESMVKGKEELFKDIPAREELNTKIWRLRARVVDFEAMNLAKSAKYIKKLEENVIYYTKVDGEMTEQKNEYARLESRLKKVKAKFTIMAIPDASNSDLLKAIVTYFVEEVKRLESERDTLFKTLSDKGYICKAKIDRGICLGVLGTQLGPRTTELIESGRAIVIFKLKVQPLDVGGSTADSRSAEKKPL